jgi:hypothetical protein
VRSYAAVVAEITSADIRHWPRDKQFARMRAITLEAILRVVIGVRDEARC